MRTYSPYGETVQSLGDFATPYAFTGELTDASGLIYLRARYYDPAMGRFVSRDTWQGDYQNPLSLNRWEYGNANPTRYTDPTGHNPAVVLAAILPSLIGLAAGIGAGAAAGAIYGACTYEWAISGKCGCDIQMQASSMTRWDWIGMNTLSGGLIGGFSGALAGAGPAGLIVLGVVTMSVSIADIIPAIKEMKTTGITACTVTRAFMDVAGIVFGATGIAKGIRAWRTSGSPLSWSTLINGRLNRLGEPYPNIRVEKYGKVPFPAGEITNTDPYPMRSQFTQEYRMNFRQWWNEKYGWYPSPEQYEIHHIKPLNKGGTNIYTNLIPLKSNSEHLLFTKWWLNYP